MEPSKKSMDAPDASKDAVKATDVESKSTAKGGARSVVKPAKRASDRASRTSPVSVSRTSTPASTSAKVKESSSRLNRVRETRIERMMSKAELARRAGISVLTIDRVEKGLGCRMDTKQ